MDEWDQETADLSPLLIAIVGTHVVALDRHTGARVWDFDSETSYWGRMAIANERVVVGASDRLACLDHDTGKVLWDVISPISTEHTMLANRSEVIVGSSGEIAAFALSNGRLLWHEPFKGYGTHAVAFGIEGVGVMPIDRTG